MLWHIVQFLRNVTWQAFHSRLLNAVAVSIFLLKFGFYLCSTVSLRWISHEPCSNQRQGIPNWDASWLAVTGWLNVTQKTSFLPACRMPGSAELLLPTRMPTQMCQHGCLPTATSSDTLALNLHFPQFVYNFFWNVNFRFCGFGWHISSVGVCPKPERRKGNKSNMNCL